MDALTFDSTTGCLAITGELTVYQAPEVRNAIVQASDTGALRSFDLSAVSELDSAGLQLIMSIKKTPATAHVAIVAASPAVMSVLSLLQLESQVLNAQAEERA